MYEIKEKKLNNYPEAVSYKSTKTILDQMKKNICKICMKDGSKGTGFFCKIPFPNNNHLLPVLITNNHVMNELYLNSVKSFIIKQNENEFKEILLDNRLKYTNKEYDITIIEIKEKKDGINEFLNIDEDIINEESNISYLNESIYILQYPNDEKLVSYGILKDIMENKQYNFNHLCCTYSRSSGSPILNLINNKVIGIHKEANKNNYNRGLFLNYPIKDFIKNNENVLSINNHRSNIINSRLNKPEVIKNEIILTIDISDKDINNNIYFLDYAWEDGFKEFNNSNVNLFINNKKEQFKNYFIPEKEGIYTIRLEPKFLMKNCRYMFRCCEKITSINLSSFNSKNVVDISYIFCGCSKLKNINLDSFNTKNVKTMRNTFRDCYSLNNLNLLSFDTTNVIDMHSMFRGCTNLKSINLSTFNVQNVEFMDRMFLECHSLANLDLSNFNSKNLIYLSEMFMECKELTNINLSSFNTNKVTNFSNMFSECLKLKTIDISNFYIKKDADIRYMFNFDTNMIVKVNPKYFTKFKNEIENKEISIIEA